MNKNMNFALAALLCAACVMPTMSVCADEKTYIYDEDSAVIETDQMKNAYTFVTGLGTEDVYSHLPTVRFTCVNEDGCIITRGDIRLDYLIDLYDGTFAPGDLINIRFFDYYDYSPEIMGNPLRVAEHVEKGAVSTECIHGFDGTAHSLEIEGNILDILGDDFTEVLEAENQKERDNNVHERLWKNESPEDDIPYIPCDMGDVNSDKDVDVLDVIATQKYIMGCRILNAAQLNAADVNRNGDVEASDSHKILRYVLGEIDSFEEVVAR